MEPLINRHLHLQVSVMQLRRKGSKNVLYASFDWRSNERNIFLSEYER